jgi:hypothetical protein
MLEQESPEGFVFDREDENVLPALRDAHSDDPVIVDLSPWSLARVLSTRHYLPYTPSEMDVMAALEALAIETGEAA